MDKTEPSSLSYITCIWLRVIAVCHHTRAGAPKTCHCAAEENTIKRTTWTTREVTPEKFAFQS